MMCLSLARMVRRVDEEEEAAIVKAMPVTISVSVSKFAQIEKEGIVL